MAGTMHSLDAAAPVATIDQDRHARARSYALGKATKKTTQDSHPCSSSSLSSSNIRSRATSTSYPGCSSSTAFTMPTNQEVLQIAQTIDLEDTSSINKHIPKRRRLGKYFPPASVRAADSWEESIKNIFVWRQQSMKEQAAAKESYKNLTRTQQNIFTRKIKRLMQNRPYVFPSPSPSINATTQNNNPSISLNNPSASRSSRALNNASTKRARSSRGREVAEKIVGLHENSATRTLPNKSEHSRQRGTNATTLGGQSDAAAIRAVHSAMKAVSTAADTVYCERAWKTCTESNDVIPAGPVRAIVMLDLNMVMDSNFEGGRTVNTPKAARRERPVMRIIGSNKATINFCLQTLKNITTNTEDGSNVDLDIITDEKNISLRSTVNALVDSEREIRSQAKENPRTPKN